MKKTSLYLLFTLIIAFSLALLVCDNQQNIQAKMPELAITNRIYGDFLHDTVKMAFVKKDIQDKTNNGQIFANHLTFYQNSFKFSTPNAQKPNTIDQITFRNGFWTETIACEVQIADKSTATADDIAKLSWNIDQLDWNNIPKVVASAEMHVQISPQIISAMELHHVNITNNEIRVFFWGYKQQATYITNLDSSYKDFSIK